MRALPNPQIFTVYSVLMSLTKRSVNQCGMYQNEVSLLTWRVVRLDSQAFFCFTTQLRVFTKK